MNKDLKRFGITTLIALAVFIIADIIFGYFADKTMERLPDFCEQLAKDNYRLHRMTEDVVIIGSSRGSHHYVSSQLRDSLEKNFEQHFSVYNAAIDGKLANSNSCAAEAIIERYSPKLVIFDISESQLKSDNIYDIEFGSPYYWKDSIVRRYIDDLGLKERILMKSSFYRYNGKIFRIISSFIRTVSYDDGYEPLYGATVDSTLRAHSETPHKDFNQYSLKNFENVLKKYKSKKIPLIIACSPSFRPNDNNARLKELCEKYDRPFIDMYDEEYFNNHPELFDDITHLNDAGAHVFTGMFFERLAKSLSNDFKCYDSCRHADIQ